MIEKNPSEHIFNVGNNDTISISEWVKLCYAVLGKTPQIKHVSKDINQRDYFPFSAYEYGLDVSKMYELFSNIIPMDIGLKESYEWYKNNRELVRRKDFLGYINLNLI